MTMPGHLYTPPAADLSHPNYMPGRSYALTHDAAIPNAVAAIDTVFLAPFRIFHTLRFSGGTAYVTTGGAASSMKSAIYSNSRFSRRPVGEPICRDNTGVATTTAVPVALALGVGTLAPGWYWMATKFTGTLPSMIVLQSYAQMFNFMAGSVGGNPAVVGLKVTDAYANPMPTFAEGAAFTLHGGAIPIFNLTAV